MRQKETGSARDEVGLCRQKVVGVVSRDCHDIRRARRRHQITRTTANVIRLILQLDDHRPTMYHAQLGQSRPTRALMAPAYSAMLAST